MTRTVLYAALLALLLACGRTSGYVEPANGVTPTPSPNGTPGQRR